MEKGKSSQPKKKVKMVRSKMFPDKMIPETDINRGPYISEKSGKAAPKSRMIEPKTKSSETKKIKVTPEMRKMMREKVMRLHMKAQSEMDKKVKK